MNKKAWLAFGRFCVRVVQKTILLYLSWLFFSRGMNPISALFMVSILYVHEVGHWIACIIRRLPNSGIWMIPGLGACVVVTGQIPSHMTNVILSAGGPLAGLALSVGLAATGLILPLVVASPGNWPRYLIAWAIINALINFINTVAVYPLDGGRVFKSLYASLYFHEDGQRRLKRLRLILTILTCITPVGVYVLQQILLAKFMSWMNRRAQRSLGFVEYAIPALERHEMRWVVTYYFLASTVLLAFCVTWPGMNLIQAFLIGFRAP